MLTVANQSDNHEPNILDRVHTHNCDGFIGFYSTLPATTLANNLDGLQRKIEVQTFDREKIEGKLLGTRQGLKLASRYFPKSYDNYTVENPKPANIFGNELSIRSENCGKDLLTEKCGIFVLLREPLDLISEVYSKKPYRAAYFSCKGNCDGILKNKYMQEYHVTVDEWVHIPNFLTPLRYLKK